MSRAIRALALFSCIFLSRAALAQVPVQVGPSPQTQFLDAAGAPLAGGIVCTYQAGTSTPQATYTDSSGLVQNANPVVLNSAGRANIWWTSAAYKVVLAGGGTCASPSNLQWTVDNFQVGVFLNGNNTWTGTNTFSGTTNFNGAVNLNSGGSMNGTWTGNPNFSGSPTFSGTIVASQFQSTVATGTPPLIVASTTLVPNLNVADLNGCVVSGTPSAGQFLQASSGTACGWVTASQLPQVIYSTASASSNANITATTMATVGASDSTYRFMYYVQETVIGASCTGNTTVVMHTTWQDPLEAGGASNDTPFLVANLGNGTVGRAYEMSGSGPIGGAGVGSAGLIRAKAGTVIQYSTTYTGGSACSPAPQYRIWPILEQITAN